MSVTIRGTDILFNDNSTQNTASFQSVAAGTLLYSNPIDTYTYNTSYLLSSKCILLITSGTVTVRMYLASDGNSPQTCYSRIFINGTAVGSEFSRSGGATGYLNQDFSVSAGDIIQVGTRAPAYGVTSIAYACAGVNSAIAARSLITIYKSSPF